MRRPSAPMWELQKHWTGIPAVDEQHRRLFAEVRELGVVCEEVPLRTARVRGSMQFLWQYVALHFATEERFLGWTDADMAHRERHRRFVVKLDLARRALEGSGCSQDQCRDLVRWLGEWLVSHVGGVDRALVERRHHHPVAGPDHAPMEGAQHAVMQ